MRCSSQQLLRAVILLALAGCGASEEAPAGGVAPSCLGGLATLASTSELTLVEGPVDCASPDASEVRCGIFKARVETPAPSSGPSDDPSLDDTALPIPVLITVRHRPDVATCSARWIALDAGGFGAGYAPSFGEVPPGHVVPGGGGYGDDLIRAYNDAGYVTADLSYDCPENEGGPCARAELAGWLPPAMGGGTQVGRAWYRDTDRTGFTGSATRSRAFYAWAHAQGGGRPICAHAQSSGSGRLNTTLTRFPTAHLFDTIVFDGGPVFLHPPWLCGIDEGPLGPRPQGFLPSQVFAQTWDCAMSPAPNEKTCAFRACKDAAYAGNEEAFLRESVFLHAEHRSFPELDVSVVFGGADDSDAPQSAVLWLTGYAFGATTLAPLEARSITVRQGFCAAATGSYQTSRSCQDWAAVTGAADLGYDARLVPAPHETASDPGGSEVLRERMLATCEP
jgi:hypothetical protein